ncbi:MAG: ATP phosphoribosyltransferase regulatory subunit [gamma proteobacterium symbiont of Bathyaustriella thionipta]|nr:ATP phosphoribosyltransferase regulatory subunit [gamma proteobacterium symbiont of Bathyaustriella thionipta]MCU7948802.1 ATP phosphoribosyltransferase regulatory subunit [gamma proteobacterium symbiont of Bathyaustriella thionipta]MCU7954214.1 ATP phosphoribosyltransferase regulatory subunit [gamma proteobacterium symbiont of Bathyaustriella thionipta]MCU7955260.1 ATP phosphoribosyltransferase regulatory subunit [gamma proteobacterium symbiont of Bathyaustriella thionipta]MCU7966269.1 ATP 
MLNKDRWLLPEGIQEVLSPQALTIESQRRSLLDLYQTWGYDLVEPPMIDFLDSLLTGTGHDLQLMTFTLTDQISGKLLGVRADMTPQIARIDAHHIKTEQPSRFCYIGQVLKTKLEDFSQSRSPLQVGIELYGHKGASSDIEVLLLMIQTLNNVGLKDFHIDLGHVGIFRSMARRAELSEVEEDMLFDALQRKAVTELSNYLSTLEISDEQKQQFMSLTDLNGDISVIEKARSILSGDEVQTELDNLEAIAKGLLARVPEQTLYFDLSELRGYNYHTGVVFAAYLPGHGQEVAKGGRYDGIGKTFGRSRAATGFSTDLTHLVSLVSKPEVTAGKETIFAPAVNDTKLMQMVSQLRQQGKRVICELADSNSNAQALGCTHTLSNDSGEWQVLEVTSV